jgi:hypothetical protein
MFGFIKKIFGGKPAETVAEVPYKVEAPIATEVVEAPKVETPKVETAPVKAAPKKKAAPKQKTAPKAPAKKGPRKPKAKAQ